MLRFFLFFGTFYEKTAEPIIGAQVCLENMSCFFSFMSSVKFEGAKQPILTPILTVFVQLQMRHLFLNFKTNLS